MGSAVADRVAPAAGHRHRAAGAGRLALDIPLFGVGVGLDSLTGTLLLRQVRQRFGVDAAAEDLNLDSLATLGTLATFVSDRVVAARTGGA